MQRFRNKTVLITGASSGIGAALAKEFAVHGARLILLARRVDWLETVAQPLRAQGTNVLVYGCDVASDSELAAVVADLNQKNILIDVVVANAGFGVVGRFDELTLADFERQFDTNVFGVLRTIYATLDMVRRRCGSVVIMGSISGHVAQPGASPYVMSKFAVRALAEALRVELAPDGVAVTLLSPGLIESNLRRVDNQGVFHPQATDPFPAWLRMSAARAARQMVQAIHARKAGQVITLHGKLVVWLSRHLPGLLRYVFKFGGQGRPQARE